MIAGAAGQSRDSCQNEVVDTSDDDARPPDGGGTKQVSVRLFGTFQGVFTPTLLTILGVIMYLLSLIHI